MIPSWVVRYGSYPFHQLKNHRQTELWLRRLKESERWPLEKLRNWQEERLRDLLVHAYQNVPYYREKFLSEGIDTEGGSVENYWSCIPLLSKQQVREAFERLQAVDRHRPYTTVRTSGSTGQPVTWRVDWRAEDVHHAGKRRAREWWGLGSGVGQVWLWGRDEFLGPRNSLRDLLVHNKRVLGLLDLTPETVRDFYRKLIQWRPVYLYGYPSGLVEFARLCAEKNFSLRRLKLKGIITTAEILSESHRAYLQEAFGSPIINEYGCAEVQVIAFQCPAGSMHLQSDTLIVEFLREGRPVAEGELGEIVVTDLFNEGMPLIRYRTGDSGRPKKGLCPCGRTLPLMEISVGRELDWIRLPNGREVHPEVFTPPHENPIFRLVERFRVIQEDLRSLRVQVVTDEERFDEVRHSFVELILGQLGEGFQIRVERVAEIPRDPSGKLRYFVSQVKSSTPELMEAA